MLVHGVSMCVCVFVKLVAGSSLFRVCAMDRGTDRVDPVPDVLERAGKL